MIPYWVRSRSMVAGSAGRRGALPDRRALGLSLRWQRAADAPGGSSRHLVQGQQATLGPDGTVGGGQGPIRSQPARCPAVL